MALRLMLWLCVFFPSIGAAQELSFIKSFGCDDCDGIELFTLMGDLAVNSEGKIFVLDAYEPHLRVLNSSEPPFGVGKSGQGPGEFEKPFYIDADGDSNIYILDMSSRRLTIFDKDLTVKSIIKTPGFPMFGGLHPRAGTFFLVTPDYAHSSSKLFKLNDKAWNRIDMSWEFFEEDRNQFMYFAFSPTADGGFSIGEGGSVYLIHKFDEKGLKKGEFRKLMGLTLKTIDEQNEEREGIRRITTQVGAKGSMKVAEHKRHFYMYSTQIDNKGRLWVLSGRSKGRPTVFDVFDQKGHYLKETAIHQSLKRFKIHDSFLAGSGEDEQGVAFVSLWEINDALLQSN